MPIQIKIYRSVTGTDPADFALIQTITDPAPTPWSWTDPGPFLAGRTYIYEAQRYDPSTGLSSAMSPPVFATGPSPLGGETLSNTATGIQTKLGIGREAVYGSPVLSQKLLNRKSGSIEMEFADPDHESLRGITTDVESVPGVSKCAGGFKITVTPEGFTRMICSLLGDPTSVTTAAVIGPPAVAAYQTHTWLDNFSQSPQTITEVKGPSFFVYPGCKADSMTISVDKTQNLPVEMDFSVMALNKVSLDTEAHLGTDVAGFDPLSAFGPSQAQLTVNSLVSDSAKQFSLNFKKNMSARDVLNMYRGPVAHFIKKTDLTGSANQYFDTEAAMKIFFGVLDAQATPYGASKTIRTVPISLLIQSEPNLNGYRNQIILTAPRCSYKKVGQQVNGPDEIMQAVDFKAYHDPATGSAFKMQLVNGETLASIIAAGTAFAVGTLPANGVQPLVI